MHTEPQSLSLEKALEQAKQVFLNQFPKILVRDRGDFARHLWSRKNSINMSHHNLEAFLDWYDTETFVLTPKTSRYGEMTREDIKCQFSKLLGAPISTLQFEVEVENEPNDFGYKISLRNDRQQFIYLSSRAGNNLEIRGNIVKTAFEEAQNSGSTDTFWQVLLAIEERLKSSHVITAFRIVAASSPECTSPSSSLTERYEKSFNNWVRSLPIEDGQWLDKFEQFKALVVKLASEKQDDNYALLTIANTLAIMLITPQDNSIEPSLLPELHSRVDQLSSSQGPILKELLTLYFDAHHDQQQRENPANDKVCQAETIKTNIKYLIKTFFYDEAKFSQQVSDFVNQLQKYADTAHQRDSRISKAIAIFNPLGVGSKFGRMLNEHIIALNGLLPKQESRSARGNVSDIGLFANKSVPQAPNSQSSPKLNK